MISDFLNKRFLFALTLTVAVSFGIRCINSYIDDSNAVMEHPATTEEMDKNGRVYVDLGLPSGLRWAKCNVGANSLNDPGVYMTYDHIYQKIYSERVEYYTLPSLVDGWIGWIVPTDAQFNELITYCTWTWNKTYKGYDIVGPNGNAIFLPADKGVGKYWTSIPHRPHVSIYSLSYYLYFNKKERFVTQGERKCLMNIRMVLPK